MIQIALAIALLLPAAQTPAPATRLSEVNGPYFGHRPPGAEPEAFNLPVFENQRGPGVFGDDGKEFFYTASDAAWHWSRIMATRMRHDGTWIEPEVVPFSGTEVDWGVFLAPDGKKLFFGSGRPIQPPNPASWNLDIWMAERTEQGWSKTVKLPINSDAVSDYASPCARNGNLYWSRFPAGIYSRNLYWMSAQVIEDVRKQSMPAANPARRTP